jgi:hypothetical protein
MMRSSILPVLLALSIAACGTETSAAPGQEPQPITSLVPAAPPPAAVEQPIAPVEPLVEPPPAEPEPGADGCDPNYYHEPCVPIDSDVDCAGGRGNGPSYVRGPVRVIRRDIYRLDHDRDGIGCDR